MQRDRLYLASLGLLAALLTLQTIAAQDSDTNPPIIDPFSFPPYLREGFTVTVLCGISSGDRPVHFSWLKDGNPIPASLQIEVKNPDEYSLLIFRDVSSRHNGNYTCVASNMVAKVNHTAQLAVKDPPIIDPFSFPPYLREGFTVTVLCGISSGDRPVHFSWLKDGNPIPASLQIQVENLDEYSLLIFRDVSSRHNGDYTCVASNMVAKVSHTAQLAVKGSSTRGEKKFGDRCDITAECGFPGAVCDPGKRSCQCTPDLPVTNHLDKCGKESTVNESCFFNEQCETNNFQTECRDGRCICRFEMVPSFKADGSSECIARNDPQPSMQYIDPAMIGILAGMALMFVIICVVLRLFSKARWRENRTIFNTPNPRLMNVSLLRDSKLLHGAERRGSRASMRAPSRQPSQAELRPHSPNAGQDRRGSHASSNASATSSRSNRSPTGNHNNHLYINPKTENVTIEVQEPTA